MINLDNKSKSDINRKKNEMIFRAARNKGFNLHQFNLLNFTNKHDCQKIKFSDNHYILIIDNIKICEMKEVFEKGNYNIYFKQL